MPKSSADSAAHSDRGLQQLLLAPVFYRLLQNVLGARRVRERFVHDYLRPGAADRVLDLGCGTGDLLESLPEATQYTGVDINPRYVAAGSRRFPGRSRFLVGDVQAMAAGELGGPFDRVALVALLHHLEDDAARALLAVAARLLSPGGTVVTVDPVLLPAQPAIARFVIRRDRGQRVRSPEGYRALFVDIFEELEGAVRNDLLRIPYSHFLVRAARPSR